MTVSNSFTITYRISLYHDEDINSKIENLCLEQSVELPRAVLKPEVEYGVVGSLTRLDRNNDATYNAQIRFPVDNIGGEIAQFLNVIYGNISLVPGIQVKRIQWDELPDGLLHGPAFGIDGVRKLLGIHDRALSCTALKPLGSSASDLAAFAKDFAEGGIDLIKDDHGITNQPYAPFEERVKRCVDAVREGSEAAGHQSWYIPHISADGDELLKRFEFAKAHGAGAVMICPQLCSPDALNTLAAIKDGLPILAHPAFSGAYVQDKRHGFSKEFLYGALWRALGADFIIFPNHAGRFSFTMDECHSIVNTSRDCEIPFKCAFPMPGGGIKRESLPHWMHQYGKDTVFLIGGSLYQHPGGIKVAANEIRSQLEEAKYE